MYDRTAALRRPPAAAHASHAAHAARAAGELLMSDIGPLKLCRNCDEYWPADGEFFSRDARRRDGLEHVCKACRKEQRIAR
ncbi:hypothetical protein AB4Z48_01070 [Cupriavidus sp. 2TAF22]|uniref:hypothetical protein n=1 Tax=unclassified Cupriavidus TaxID=2640874 RepID=UPI003F93F434